MKFRIFVSIVHGNYLKFESDYLPLKNIKNEKEKVEIQYVLTSKEAKQYFENLKRLKFL